jgi:hypothetical protein
LEYASTETEAATDCRYLDYDSNPAITRTRTLYSSGVGINKTKQHTQHMRLRILQRPKVPVGPAGPGTPVQAPHWHEHSPRTCTAGIAALTPVRCLLAEVDKTMSNHTR